MILLPTLKVQFPDVEMTQGPLYASLINNFAIAVDSFLASSLISASNIIGNKLIINAAATETNNDFKLILQRNPGNQTQDVTITLPYNNGSPGQILQLDGNNYLQWVNASLVGFQDPMTSIGDIIIRNGSNQTTRLPIGTSGYVLTVVGSVPTWQPTVTTLSNLSDVQISGITNADILVYSSGSGTWVNRAMSGDATISSAGAITLTKGALSETGSSILTITNGGSAVIGSGTTIQVTKADGAHNGYLSSSDWNFFHGKMSDDFSNAVGALSISHGGTGQTTANNAINALLPSQTGNNGKFLQSDGTNTSWTSAGGGTVTSVTSAYGPLSVSNPTTAPVITLQVATSSQDGYLTQGDWTTFNNKGTVSSVSVVFSGTSANAPIVITSATSTPLLTLTKADSTHDGYLTQGDWTTFNGKITNPMTTEGDIIYQHSGGPTRLGIGGNATILNSNGTDPQWSTLSSLNIPTGSGSNNTIAKWTSTNTIGNSTITDNGTYVGFTEVIDVATAGNSYNEGIRIHPSSSGDYASLVLGAVTGQSGTGAGQWTLIRFPTAGFSNKFSIRYNSTDQLVITTAGNVTFGGNLTMTGSTSGTLTQQPAGTTTSYTITWPSAQGGASTVLQNDGSGNLSWSSAGAGTVTSVTSAYGPLSVANSTTTPVITLPQATSSQDGYLTQGDWTTFNNKVSTSRAINTTAPLTGGGNLSADRTIALTTANLVSAYGPLSISNGTNVLAGSTNATITLQVATSSQDGYLTQGDWTTFNNKLNTSFSNVLGTLGISNGGTGQTTALAAFDALSPLTTEGDILYYHSSHNARLGIGGSGTVLSSNGTDPSWSSLSSLSIPSGTGTTNTITKWTGTNTIGGSSITNTSTEVNSALGWSTTSATNSPTVVAGDVTIYPAASPVSGQTLTVTGSLISDGYFGGAGHIAGTGTIYSTSVSSDSASNPAIQYRVNQFIANGAATLGKPDGTSTHFIIGALTCTSTVTIGTSILFNGSTSGATTVLATAVASGTLTLPAATDTLVGRATTDTLTNKTISGSSNTITNVSLTSGVTGTLPLGNGGTNATSFTGNRIPKANSGATALVDSGVSDDGTTVSTSELLTTTNSTDASSTSTGSFVASGGVGIAKKLYVGTSVSVTSGPTIDGTAGGGIKSANTGGTTIAAGYIGERIAANSAGGVSPAASGSFANVASITVTAGVWLITACAVLAPSTLTGLTDIGAGISTSSSAMTGNYNVGGYTHFSQTGTPGATDGFYIPCGPRYVNVSGSTTYYLLGIIGYTTDTGTTWHANSMIQAIRIA